MKIITKNIIKIFAMLCFLCAADLVLMKSITHFYFNDLRDRIDAKGIDKESPLRWLGPECREELNTGDYDITNRYTEKYMYKECLDRKIKTW